MLRRLLNLSFLLVTFSLSLSAAVVAQMRSVKAEEPSMVSLCDVVRNPRRYNNRIIRMQATYVYYLDGAYLYGERCDQPQMQVDPVFPICKKTDKPCQQVEGALESLVARKDGKRAMDGQTQAIFIGRFRRVYRRSRNRDGTISYRIGPNADLRFELRLTHIERHASEKN